MNKHITEYNNGKQHQPILKVRVSEPKGAKYQVGETGNKTSKFVEAQKGTNLYFAIYEDKEGNRSYNTIPLNEAAERMKQGYSPVETTNSKGNVWIIVFCFEVVAKNLLDTSISNGSNALSIK